MRRRVTSRARGRGLARGVFSRPPPTAGSWCGGGLRCAIVFRICDPRLKRDSRPGACASPEMDRRRESTCGDSPVKCRSGKGCDPKHVPYAIERRYDVRAFIREFLGDAHRRLEPELHLRVRRFTSDGHLEHSSRRRACRGCGLEPRVISSAGREPNARSRAIHSSTSDRCQPIARPWKVRLFGKRPRRQSPMSIQRGRRIRRATSCALSNS